MIIIVVQGLGYVGSAMAVAVASKLDNNKPSFDVIGIDLPNRIGQARIDSINAGKFPGTLVTDSDQAKYWNDRGINFLIGSANRFLMNGSKEFIETTRAKLKSPSQYSWIPLRSVLLQNTPIV